MDIITAQVFFLRPAGFRGLWWNYGLYPYTRYEKLRIYKPELSEFTDWLNEALCGKIDFEPRPNTPKIWRSKFFIFEIGLFFLNVHHRWSYQTKSWQTHFAMKIWMMKRYVLEHLLLDWPMIGLHITIFGAQISAKSAWGFWMLSLQCATPCCNFW